MPASQAPATLPGLDREHRALLAQYGEIQKRCSTVIAAQAAEIARLQAQAVRLRAAAMVRESALAWAREDRLAMEASLAAADLVICQVGCVSHDAYWRVQDHCRRTGKQCVLVDQPLALQRVRDQEPASPAAEILVTTQLPTHRSG
jgi:hypothetical protein